MTTQDELFKELDCSLIAYDKSVLSIRKSEVADGRLATPLNNKMNRLSLREGEAHLGSAKSHNLDKS